MWVVQKMAGLEFKPRLSLLPAAIRQRASVASQEGRGDEERKWPPSVPPSLLGPWDLGHGFWFHHLAALPPRALQALEEMVSSLPPSLQSAC